ncbi:MAG: acetyl-CoA carboxylase biotin carboxyl carrier protein [Chitinophagales bacterium]|nr:acetyl-CoA carboxylase biotin carboxyl carrier protein [Chitinophagales bacterium]MDW8419843.1 acetyl-CoA carboxylase biotin carboxyl carrier protein [Chitinophagales bacterium]
MDLKIIQDLIRLVKKSDISELTVKEGDLTITVKNKAAETVVYTAPAQAPAVTAPAAPQPPVNTSAAVSGTEVKPAKSADNEYIFRSPMVGTFYRKPGVDKEPFVKVGDPVQPGTVLCIIEAMKLFNQIEYDGPAGTIAKVLVDDASPVEFDQPLFVIAKA